MADILHFPSQHQRRAVVEKYTGGFMQSMFEIVNKLASPPLLDGCTMLRRADEPCNMGAATGKDGSRAASRKADGTLGNETRQDCGSDEVESLIPQVSSIRDGAEGYDRVAGLQLRCEMWRSPGWDVTRENSLLCNAPTARVCLHCGPICGECASEYACCGLTSEHEF